MLQYILLFLNQKEWVPVFTIPILIVWPLQWIQRSQSVQTSRHWHSIACISKWARKQHFRLITILPLKLNSMFQEICKSFVCDWPSILPSILEAPSNRPAWFSLLQQNTHFLMHWDIPIQNQMIENPPYFVGHSYFNVQQRLRHPFFPAVHPEELIWPACSKLIRRQLYIPLFYGTIYTTHLCNLFFSLW